jgi:hypothetical protein
MYEEEKTAKERKDLEVIGAVGSVKHKRTDFRYVGLAIRSVTTPSFLQERFETGFRVYQKDMLQGAIKHLNPYPANVENMVSS